jgi:hypothetical protein
VPIFLERFVLPIFAALMVGVILLNPLKFDMRQRTSLCIGVLALAYFVGHTLHKSRPSTDEPQSKPEVVQSAPESGDATTSGDNSPAVPGNGNTIVYGSAPHKKHRSTTKREGEP